MKARLLLALALANGVLYCCALPLWEGFDEPFHYAYVESLVKAHSLPVTNRTEISEEIRESFNDVPLSRLLSQAMPGSMSFEEWSKIGDPEKRVRQGRLASLHEEMRRSSGGVLNYESQQAPLAYFLYAPFDYLSFTMKLSSRILVLRLVGTLAATLATFAALSQLAALLGITGDFLIAALLVVFSGQMFWASVAHVGNDFAALPLSIWFLLLLMRSAMHPASRNLLALSGVLAAGLLTKAYFLAFAPVLLLLLVYLVAARKTSKQTAICSAAFVVLVAGPWYLRNYLLYGTLSGTQQSLAGIGFSQALGALPRINWLSSASQFALWSLWTGNWSFLSFSQITLKLELLLLVASFVFYARTLKGRGSLPQVWLLSACALFGLSLVYQTCVTWVHTSGASTFPEPWYAQGIVAVGILLCFRGLAQSRAAGRIVAACLVLLTGWIALATYFAKLLPYYGAAISRANARTVWLWWSGHPSADLASIAMVPVPLIYLLLWLFVALLGAITVPTVRALWVRVRRA